MHGAPEVIPLAAMLYTNMNHTHHIIGLSGGKDSTATLLLALDRLTKDCIQPVFVDTGNEHPATYNYLSYLESYFSIQITRLKPDFTEEIAAKRRFIALDRRTGRDKHGVKLRWSNRRKREALAELKPSGSPFLDLCLLKGMFPSNRSRFCTDFLKTRVFVSFVDEMAQSHKKVIIWQGIRRDESDKRKNAKLFERVGPRFYYFRPLINWSEKDVFQCIADHGLHPNPLYQSLGRVGCAPCIYSNKKDLRGLFNSDDGPEILQKMRGWEVRVSRASKTGQAVFFQGKELAGAHLGEVHPLVFFQRHRIDAIQHWASKHTRFVGDDWQDFEKESSCSSEWGLCE